MTDANQWVEALDALSEITDVVSGLRKSFIQSGLDDYHANVLTTHIVINCLQDGHRDGHRDGDRENVDETADETSPFDKWFQSLMGE